MTVMQQRCGLSGLARGLAVAGGFAACELLGSASQGCRDMLLASAAVRDSIWSSQQQGW
jgi:hypothetical protein